MRLSVLPLWWAWVLAAAGSSLIAGEMLRIESSLDAMGSVYTIIAYGEDRNIQLIIETHSEHFLHRLQRRIAEADPEHPISADQVAAYFAHTTGGESKLELLQINADGDILNWPDKFFGDSMGDLFAKSKAAARRRQQARQAEVGQ